MKICAIICEFNPFHNGHKHIIETVKRVSGCDFLVCIMSGSFTQRGDIAILEKSVRARHAVLCGADAVIELPVAFAVAPAEIFAKGAVKILGSIPAVECIAFGCENKNADFLGAAKLLNAENGQFRQILNKKLSEGESYVKSYASAFESCGGDGALISHPNNILGVEYAKAILRSGANISLLPIQRIGQNFGETGLCTNFSSAKAIRSDISNCLVKDNVPECVFKDLKTFSAEKALFEDLLRFKLLYSTQENMRRIYGCSEGLENNILSHCGAKFGELIEAATGKRYTESRIRRILVANLLELYGDDCEKYLAGPLYVKPLAIKNKLAPTLLPELSKSSYPLLLKQRDIGLLTENAQKCLKKDIFADKMRSFIFKQTPKEFEYPQFIE